MITSRYEKQDREGWVSELATLLPVGWEPTLINPRADESRPYHLLAERKKDGLCVAFRLHVQVPEDGAFQGLDVDTVRWTRRAQEDTGWPHLVAMVNWKESDRLEMVFRRIDFLNWRDGGHTAMGTPTRLMWPLYQFSGDLALTLAEAVSVPIPVQMRLVG